MAYEIRMPGGMGSAQETAMMRQIITQVNFALNAMENEITQLRKIVEADKREER